VGQRMEHGLRSWRIACRLAERVGLADDEQRSLFFIAMLSWVGCVADTPEVAAWFGDDIAFRGESYQVELTRLPGLGFLVGRAGAGGSVLRRVRLGSTLALTGGKGIVRVLHSHCATTSVMAAQLGLGPGVCNPLRQFFTRWDGRGVPGGVGGEQIAATVRLFHVADVVEVYHQFDGVQAAIEVAR